MNPPTDDSIWQSISKALFGVRSISDERLFTARVMAEVRQLQPVDLPWRSFLRWTVPVLGVAMASLILALRAPAWTTPLSTDAMVFQSETPDEELAAATLGE